MSEAKHTPGKWYVTGKATLYIESNHKPGWVQEVCSVGPTEVDEQQHANARLIAAAPELLEALIDVLTWMDAPDESAFSDSQLAKARAAIAKATGSSEVTE